MLMTAHGRFLSKYEQGSGGKGKWVTSIKWTLPKAVIRLDRGCVDLRLRIPGLQGPSTGPAKRCDGLGFSLTHASTGKTTYTTGWFWLNITRGVMTASGISRRVERKVPPWLPLRMVWEEGLAVERLLPAHWKNWRSSGNQQRILLL